MNREYTINLLSLIKLLMIYHSVGNPFSVFSSDLHIAGIHTFSGVVARLLTVSSILLWRLTHSLITKFSDISINHDMSVTATANLTYSLESSFLEPSPITKPPCTVRSHVRIFHLISIWRFMIP